VGEGGGAARRRRTRNTVKAAAARASRARRRRLWVWRVLGHGAAFYRAAAGLGVRAQGSARRGKAETRPDSDASPSRTHAGGRG
jgi:hypothetical protein